MTIQIRKTYRGINLEMLYAEIRDLLQKQGVLASTAKTQTYGLPSGETQSRSMLVLKTQAAQEKDQKECGSIDIIGSPNDETKMLLDVDENLFSQEKLSAFQENLNFTLGSYEVRW